MTNKQPSFLDPSHRGHEVLAKIGIVGAPSLELACLTIHALYTVTQCSQPNITPLVFCHRPYVIVQQSVLCTCCQYIGNVTIRSNLNQSAIVCTKPKAAIARTVT